jgi:hypothetical protein
LKSKKVQHSLPEKQNRVKKTPRFLRKQKAREKKKENKAPTYGSEKKPFHAPISLRGIPIRHLPSQNPALRKTTLPEKIKK